MEERIPPLKNALIGGAFAGLFVDLTLFPLDTLKTRLQSEKGFIQSGGFRKIYSGVFAQALGSAPNAAIFFLVYEGTKKCLSPISSNYDFMKHAFAASLGDFAACSIRVPTEVIKQRRQAFSHLTLSSIVKDILAYEGAKGFYRGFWSTVSREIPFSFIQYPLWEFNKKIWALRRRRRITPWESAIAGSLAGGVAAGITTPLDVVKTRIMLSARDHTRRNILQTMKEIKATHGLKGLYAGVVPRSLWMSIGGAVYFGVYETVITFMEQAPKTYNYKT